MNYTNKQIENFAIYTYNVCNLDLIFKEIGILSYIEGSNLKDEIRKMHLKSDDFDYIKAEKIMKTFKIEFKIEELPF